MASATKIYKCRQRLKRRKAGRKRKNRIEREGSTPTRAALFGDKDKNE